MSLVFAALVPHPPLLIPAIGREHAKLLDKTWGSYQRVQKGLAEAEPDTILLVSPHLPIMPETFTVNIAPKVRTHFVEFGDFSTPRAYSTDALLVERIRHAGRLAGNQIILVCDDHVDYGSGVPLHFLPAVHKPPTVVIISPTQGPPKMQFAFGQMLKEVVLHSKKRIAVICSADLSHRHSSDSPAGFSKKAKEFDEKMLMNLGAGNASPILQMSEELIAEAHPCGYKPICMTLGLLDRIEHRPELLSYEAPFGVGYATMQFHLT